MAIKKESGGKPAIPPPPKTVPKQAIKSEAADKKKTTSLNAASAAVAAANKSAAAYLQAQASPNFKGVGLTPYLDKNGKVENLGNIPKSGGPSTGGKPEPDDFKNTNLGMDPIPEVIIDTTPAVVRTPTRNVTDISSLVPQFDAEQIQKLLFENISAIELSKVERHDTIEGIDQKYSIISNLSEVRKKYDMVKQLTIMDKFKPLTSIFTINIEDKIPQEDYLALENLNSTYQYLDENNQTVTREKGYYYIDTNGDLVVELINLEKNQQVEILIDTNGTIYKVESWLQQMAKIS